MSKDHLKIDELLDAFTRLKTNKIRGVEEPLVEAVNKLPPAEKHRIALSLLDSESESMWRAAYLILAKCPTPSANDRLWNRYRHLFPKGTQPTSLNFNSYKEISAALLACAVLDIGWLERTILGAANTDPVYQLVIALSLSHDGKAAWLRSKHKLFASVDPNQKLSLAANIRVHKDVDEKHWLLEQLSEPGMTSVYALWALSALDIELAIKSISKVRPNEFYMCREWCFVEMWILRRDLLESELAHLLSTRPDNFWTYAAVYQGNANLASPLICDLMLDNATELIVKELAEPSPSNVMPLWRPLDLLAQMASLDQIQCFERRRNSQFENVLTNWLLREGPRNGVWARHPQDYGLQVLYRIGGLGITKVITSYLESQSQYGRSDGLHIAFKRTDPEVRAALNKIVSSTFIWGPDNNPGYVGEPHPVEQQQAIRALSILECWDDVLMGVARWGHLVSHSLIDQRGNRSIGSEALIDSLRQKVVLNLDDNLPVLVALGLARDSKITAQVKSTLGNSIGESELALTCAVVLEYLQDTSDEAIALFGRLLSTTKSHYVAARALFRIGSLQALQVLEASLDHKFDNYIFGELKHSGRNRKHLASLLWRQLQVSPRDASTDADVEILSELKEDPEIRTYVREHATSTTSLIDGAKASAIRALIVIDKEHAFRSLINVLHDVNSGDRIYMPDLLVAHWPTMAREILTSHALIESDSRVYLRCVEALSKVISIAEIRGMLTADNADTRKLGCDMANQLCDDSLAADLTKLVTDVSDQVAGRARLALLALHRDRQIGDVHANLDTEQIPDRQWVLRDSALHLSNSEYGIHRWANKLTESTSFFVKEYVLGRLKREDKA